MAGSGVLVKLLSYAGLRWGEAVALRPGNVDALRRLVHVGESATLVNGELVWGTSKSHRARTVVIPRFLAEELAPLLDGEGLVFTSPVGAALRSPNFLRRTWQPAVAECDHGDLVPHDLRLTAASLAISAGASVKAVQRMLGHNSALRSQSTGTPISSMMTSRRWLSAWMLVTVRPKAESDDVLDLDQKRKMPFD